MSRHHLDKLPPDWRVRRVRVFHRDGYQCVKCGSREHLECDHIVRLSEGGSHDMENLRTLCRDCHIADTRERFLKASTIAGQADWGAFVAASPLKRRRILTGG